MSDAIERIKKIRELALRGVPGGEKDMFLRAFIQKHRLFGNRVDNIKPDKMSDEEIEKMLSMMGGLSDVSPHKGIESHVSATKTK